MDYSQLSMHDLFRMEAETQLGVLAEGVLHLNEAPDDADTLEAMMRAAHSLKGAARIVQMSDAVTLAHQMEDVMVAMQQGKAHWHEKCAAPMLRAIDLLHFFAEQKPVDTKDIETTTRELQTLLQAPVHEQSDDGEAIASTEEEKKSETAPSGSKTSASTTPSHVRISPQHIERMLGLASEIQAEWQWLRPLGNELQRLKRQAREAHSLLGQALDLLRPGHDNLQQGASSLLEKARSQLQKMQQHIQDGQLKLEQYDRNVFRQSQQLHDLSVDCRMQPFSHGIQGLRRMVHELGEELGKKVRLHIEGGDTLVDRDILEKIKAPLQHLLRNAVDHGIGDAQSRRQMGKPEEGNIYLQAMHQSGMLKIVVADDGAGIDMEALRKRIVQRGHANAEMVEKMRDAELLSFLFLPGFSMKDTISEISGRGVGLDVVEMAVRDVQGVMHVETELGKGTRFELHLPVSLAVTRALQVRIAGQPWAVPLARLYRAISLREEEVSHTEGQAFFELEQQRIGLVQASNLLGLSQETLPMPWHVLVLGQPPQCLGLIVDEFVAIRDLVEKPLPELLGKVQDIASCAVLPDGSLLYMLDTQDMLRSMARFLASRQAGLQEQDEERRARILVADDSITVRETERNMLLAAGYQVDAAVDGLDAWNMLCAHEYDLLISDVDMPHLDGISLITRMRQDPRFAVMPVIIVSYKENERDRMRGLEAGADAYLAKSSFDDQSLLRKVDELLGGG